MGTPERTSRPSEILVRHLGARWSTPSVVAYSDEAHLQALLASDPTRVPGVGAAAIAARELDTPAGPIDVCIVDPDGAITVVECKLAANTEHRRRVVGQVIDYASALASAGLDRFEQAWDRASETPLESCLVDVAARDRLRANIDDGRINLCIAVDRIDDDVRRMVEYLNRITHAGIGVVALELAYFRHDDLEILIPRAFGAELAEAKSRTTTGTSSATRPKWTPEDVVTFLMEDAGEKAAGFAQSLMDACKAEGAMVSGTAAADPSCVIGYQTSGGMTFPYALYTYTNGRSTLQLGFEWTGAAAMEGRLAFLHEMAQEPALAIDAAMIEAVGLRKRPNIRIDAVAELHDLPRRLAEALACLRLGAESGA